jgi:DNA invertase Pin-like site-specific DNA recombinase
MRSRLRARFGVVVALDRLGRSLSTVIRTIKTLTAAGVCTPYGKASTTAPPTGRMLAGIVAALAEHEHEHERELVHERAAADRRTGHVHARGIQRLPSRDGQPWARAGRVG